MLLDDVAWAKSCTPAAGSRPLATAVVIAATCFAWLSSAGCNSVDRAKRFLAITLVTEPVVFAVLAVGFLLVVVVFHGLAPRQPKLVNSI